MSTKLVLRSLLCAAFLVIGARSEGVPSWCIDSPLVQSYLASDVAVPSSKYTGKDLNRSCKLIESKYGGLGLCKNQRYRQHCRKTCQQRKPSICDTCRDSQALFRFDNYFYCEGVGKGCNEEAHGPGPRRMMKCRWVRKHDAQEDYCNDPDFEATCPKTCGVCSDRRRRQAEVHNSNRIRGVKEVHNSNRIRGVKEVHNSKNRVRSVNNARGRHDHRVM